MKEMARMRNTCGEATSIDHQQSINVIQFFVKAIIKPTIVLYLYVYSTKILSHIFLQWSKHKNTFYYDDSNDISSPNPLFITNIVAM